MSKDKKSIDTSTICDITLRKWSEAYPQDKVDALKEKSRLLNSAYVNTKEKLDTLTRASLSLDELTAPLLSVQNSMKGAIAKKRNFVNAFGDCGIKTAHSIEEMENTINSYCTELQEYADKVKVAFLDNLEEVKAILIGIKAVQNTYQQLADIIDIINTQYFKTEPDRRKPILRDLIRRFQELATFQHDKSFFYIMPTKLLELASNMTSFTEKQKEVGMVFYEYLKKYLPNELNPEEGKSLTQASIEAEHTAKILKSSR